MTNAKLRKFPLFLMLTAGLFAFSQKGEARSADITGQVISMVGDLIKAVVKDVYDHNCNAADSAKSVADQSFSRLNQHLIELSVSDKPVKYRDDVFNSLERDFTDLNNLVDRLPSICSTKKYDAKRAISLAREKSWELRRVLATRRSER